MMTFPLTLDTSSDAVYDMLFKLKVKDVMTSPVFTAAPHNTMREIQLLMKRSRVTGVPIVNDDMHVVGIVSMEDIVNAFDNNYLSDLAEKHMTKRIISLQESMAVSFCVTYFNRYRFGRFPVIDSEGRLCGIVTTTDVIYDLLVAMNKEVERLENCSSKTKKQKIIKPTAPLSLNAVHGGEVIFECKTEPFNFELAGHASTEIKKILKNRGIDASVIRRAGIASYELEINQVVHSTGGKMLYVLTDKELIIEAKDNGPGISDIEKVLTEGFSTATDKVRSLGFGAGMGLPNTKRVADSFNIESSLGEGTTVVASFLLKNPNE